MAVPTNNNCHLYSGVQLYGEGYVRNHASYNYRQCSSTVGPLFGGYKKPAN
jgi:hypothetical protein